jgi:flagellar hook protein FlgE
MSFQQGLSGLNTSAKQLDTIGNNVANSSTIGFKESQAQFADKYAASLAGGGGNLQVGGGSQVAAVVQQFSQGNITSTSNPMDTAISGQGFFRLLDSNGGVVYSRNGQFQLDKNGYIVNNQGHKVTGYLPNAAGAIVQTNPLPLQISAADLVPKLSANSVVGVNLDSLASVPLATVFNPNDPTTYNNSTSMTVYDSLGGSHVASLYFQRQPIAATSSAAAIPAGSTSATLASTAGMAIGNTITIPGAGAAVTPSTTASATAVGDTTATLASVAGLTPGSNITIAGNSGASTITSIAGNVVTFAPATTAVTAAGAAVTATSPQTVKLTGVNTATGVVTFNPATVSATIANAAITSNAGSSNWNSYLILDGASIPPSTAPLTPLAVLTFNTLGQVISPVGPPLGQVASATFTPVGAAAQKLTFQFGQTTQYGGSFGVNTLSQDGYASGHLSGFSTSADGTIMGRYTNGQSRAMGQMVLANFTDPQGLQPIGNNEWVESSASGGPLVGVAGSSSLGTLQSGAVEESNVDLTAELVNMITAQRVYQANAQTIKTQDQIMQTLVSLR